MKTTNKRGPSTEPCGTPEGSVPGHLLKDNTQTIFFSCFKLSIQFTISFRD